MTTLAHHQNEVRQLINISKERGDIMQKKQKKLKLVLSPPSIPTSFQTFRYSESEDNAFNTSQSRFVEGTVWYYRRNELPEDDASFSRKGFGNGFVSKMKRFGRIDATAAPNPAKYTAIKQEKVSNLVSSSFRTPLVPDELRMSNLTGKQESFATSPTIYNPYNVKPSKAYRENGPSATFKSITGRYALSGRNEMPCPGSYEITNSSPALGAVAAFKSRPRYGASERETPGPASYGSPKKTTDKPKQRRQFISIAQFTKPDERPLSTFSTRDSTAKKTKIQKATLRYVPEKLGPMPGRYNVARASCVTKASVNGITRSVFESKTRRFDGVEGPTKHLGPGFYQPITELKRSFHLNLDNHWA